MEKVKIKYIAIGTVTGLFIGGGMGFTMLNSIFERDGIVVYPFFKNKTKEYKVATYSFSQEGTTILEEKVEEYLSKGKIGTPLELNIYRENITNKENKDIATYTNDEVMEAAKEKIIDAFEVGDYEYIIRNCDNKEVNYNQKVATTNEADLTIKIVDYDDYNIVYVDDFTNLVCDITMGICMVGGAACGFNLGAEISKGKSKKKNISY